MPDDAPPLHAGRTPFDGPADPAAAGHGEALTPAAIDAVLADFRAWLTAAPPPEPPPADALDVATVVGHFTALRHEVNLLTKTARAAVEQNAEVLKTLQAPAEDRTLPLVKALIDIADSLQASLKQVERGQAALRELLHAPADEPPPGFLARLFGRKPPESGDTLAKLAPLADGLADGYAMSLRRVERVLPQFGLEAIECAGRPFDPELMEAVEVVAGGVSGAVVEEVRRGYRRAGGVFRYALVKVAR